MNNVVNLLVATVQFDKVGLVIGIVVALAVIFAVLILVVTKVCKIKEDEKVVKILQNLAGANCGGCGHTGCEGFAKSLAQGKGCINDCKPTSAENKKIIAMITGQDFEEEEPTVAVVKCSGGNRASDKFKYVGNDGCDNRMVYHDGNKICATACLGGGTCEKVCPVDAIKVGNNGVAEVDIASCISCGACKRRCPKNAIETIPATAKIYVACSTHCKGKELMAFCEAGCIGCGLCAKKCPENAITMNNSLPVIDYKKCTACLLCLQKCPRHVIKQL